jgi:hypothetical protein
LSKQRGFLRIWPVVLVLGGLFLAQQAGFFPNVLTKHVMDPLAAGSKLACQLIGCIYAARCAARYDEGSPVRSAWQLVSAWLGCFFVAQGVLSVYEVILRATPPLPSVGDAFFFIGYACVIAALGRFILAYRASGFPVGRLRDHMLVALLACAAFAILAFRRLMPIALAPTPFLERVVNVGYPLLDLVLFIPTLVLLRITVRFHGGRVWTVWAALLSCIVFTAGADILFADVSAENLKAVGPLVDLLLILSYLFGATGTRLQFEMLTD